MLSRQRSVGADFLHANNDTGSRVGRQEPFVGGFQFTPLVSCPEDIQLSEQWSMPLDTLSSGPPTVGQIPGPGSLLRKSSSHMTIGSMARRGPSISMLIDQVELTAASESHQPLRLHTGNSDKSSSAALSSHYGRATTSSSSAASRFRPIAIDSTVESDDLATADHSSSSSTTLSKRKIPKLSSIQLEDRFRLMSLYGSGWNQLRHLKGINRSSIHSTPCSFMSTSINSLTSVQKQAIQKFFNSASIPILSDSIVRIRAAGDALPSLLYTQLVMILDKETSQIKWSHDELYTLLELFRCIRPNPRSGNSPAATSQQSKANGGGVSDSSSGSSSKQRRKNTIMNSNPIPVNYNPSDAFGQRKASVVAPKIVEWDEQTLLVDCPLFCRGLRSLITQPRSFWTQQLGMPSVSYTEHSTHVHSLATIDTSASASSSLLSGHDVNAVDTGSSGSHDETAHDRPGHPAHHHSAAHHHHGSSDQLHDNLNHSSAGSALTSPLWSPLQYQGHGHSGSQGMTTVSVGGGGNHHLFSSHSVSNSNSSSLTDDIVSSVVSKIDPVVASASGAAAGPRSTNEPVTDPLLTVDLSSGESLDSQLAAAGGAAFPLLKDSPSAEPYDSLVFHQTMLKIQQALRFMSKYHKHDLYQVWRSDIAVSGLLDALHIRHICCFHLKCQITDAEAMAVYRYYRHHVTSSDGLAAVSSIDLSASLRSIDSSSQQLNRSITDRSRHRDGSRSMDTVPTVKLMTYYAFLKQLKRYSHNMPCIFPAQSISAEIVAAAAATASTEAASSLSSALCSPKGLISSPQSSQCKDEISSLGDTTVQPIRASSRQPGRSLHARNPKPNYYSNTNINSSNAGGTKSGIDSNSGSSYSNSMGGVMRHPLKRFEYPTESSDVDTILSNSIDTTIFTTSLGSQLSSAVSAVTTSSSSTQALLEGNDQASRRATLRSSYVSHLPVATGFKLLNVTQGSNTIIRCKTPLLLGRPVEGRDHQSLNTLKKLCNGSIMTAVQADIRRLPLDLKTQTLRYEKRWRLLHQVILTMRYHGITVASLLHRMQEHNRYVDAVSESSDDRYNKGMLTKAVDTTEESEASTHRILHISRQVLKQIFVWLCPDLTSNDIDVLSSSFDIPFQLQSSNASLPSSSSSSSSSLLSSTTSTAMSTTAQPRRPVPSYALVAMLQTLHEIIPQRSAPLTSSGAIDTANAATAVMAALANMSLNGGDIARILLRTAYDAVNALISDAKTFMGESQRRGSVDQQTRSGSVLSGINSSSNSAMASPTKIRSVNGTASSSSNDFGGISGRRQSKLLSDAVGTLVTSISNASAASGGQEMGTASIAAVTAMTSNPTRRFLRADIIEIVLRSIATSHDNEVLISLHCEKCWNACIPYSHINILSPSDLTEEASRDSYNMFTQSKLIDIDQVEEYIRYQSTKFRELLEHQVKEMLYRMCSTT